MEDQTIIQLLKDIVTAKKFISDNEMNYYSNKIYEDLSGKIYNVAFTNLTRRLKVTLCISTKSVQILHFMGVMITNIGKVGEDENAYSSIKGLLKEDWKLFILESYDGDFVEQLTSFFHFLDTAIEKNEYVTPILRGDLWVDTVWNWRGDM